MVNVVLLRAAPALIAALAYALVLPAAPIAVWVLAVVCGAAIPWCDRSVSLPRLGRVANAARAAFATALGLGVATALAELPWIVALAPLLSAGMAAVCSGSSESGTRCADCRKRTPPGQARRCPRCAGYFCRSCYVPVLDRCR